MIPKEIEVQIETRRKHNRRMIYLCLLVSLATTIWCFWKL